MKSERDVGAEAFICAQTTEQINFSLLRHFYLYTEKTQRCKIHPHISVQNQNKAVLNSSSSLR